MTKLHELLAVENTLAGRARSALSNLAAKFGKPDLYTGMKKRYEPLEENGQSMPDEDKILPHRVNDDLDELFREFGSWLDVSIQKEITNTQTSAEVMVNGETLIEDLPATALLNLEAKLLELAKTLERIPVNDNAVEWSWDENLLAFKSAPKISYRTERKLGHKVLYDATDHHPAQVETWNEDVRIGIYKTVTHSGAIESVAKRAMMNRLNELLLSVRQARQRANDVEVKYDKISDDIINYLRG